MSRTVELRLQQGDIGDIEADVVVLKYAQSFYGADRRVATALGAAGLARSDVEPQVGAYRYVGTRNAIRAPHALFMGVTQLHEFDYPRIRNFAKDALSALAIASPGTHHVALTIHGPGYGLDETEAFLSELDGLLDALQSGRLPTSLERITIVDRNVERVSRLQHALGIRLKGAAYPVVANAAGGYLLEVPGNQVASAPASTQGTQARPEDADTAKRPHVFVAMPFTTHLEDVYYYGIQGPVHAAGFLCERIDHEAFVGGIVEWIQQKIDTAVLVIAELTGGNPNVYLEVGYAWGRQRPTVLLTSNLEELAFDVKGHKCLTYQGIKDLEQSLAHELAELKQRQLI